MLSLSNYIMERGDYKIPESIPLLEKYSLVRSICVPVEVRSFLSSFYISDHFRIKLNVSRTETVDQMRCMLAADYRIDRKWLI